MIQCCSPDQLQPGVQRFLLARCSSLSNLNLFQTFAHKAFDEELLTAGFFMSINLETNTLLNHSYVPTS